MRVFWWEVLLQGAVAGSANSRMSAILGLCWCDGKNIFKSCVRTSTFPSTCLNVPLRYFSGHLLQKLSQHSSITLSPQLHK